MFYIIAVLMQKISLSHPEEKFIHEFPQNMEGAWPATPLFKKWKEAQIWIPRPISSFYAKFCEIWQCFQKNHKNVESEDIPLIKDLFEKTSVTGTNDTNDYFFN